MGRAGRERALKNFTWDRVADSMLKRYQTLSGIASPVPADALLEYASVDMVG
jgi:hypothetical protein